MYFGKIKNKGQLERVPPNQNITTSFPVLHAGNVPYYNDLSEWKLKVFGLVEEEKSFSYEDLLKWPQLTFENDIHCVTGWSKLDNSWEGVAVTELMAHLKLKAEAEFVILHAEEGWTTNLPISDFIRETSLLAHTHNGKPLSPEHGWPLRVVFPHLYFWKSAKWVRGIEFTATNQPGYWEKNGYHQYGDPWKEQRFTWD
ncbi:sulfite oxidase-like oxidoreductase [Mesobacillus harenae]|uniref:sulfite oxidase-like oxidoreductase n=1 Tax=Mesobacillus harenae TaxID=2213203 RepID=UPI00158037F9|nr:sulfite oxidase-like oxidoreductase [Mesobacillus harenae]